MPDERNMEIVREPRQYTGEQVFIGKTKRSEQDYDGSVLALYEESGDAHEEAFDTVSSALQAIEDSPGKGKVTITSAYDGSDETFPIDVGSSHTGTVIEGSSFEEVTVDTGGSGFMKIELSNNRTPGITVRNLSVTDTGHGSGHTFDILDTKFSTFTDVAVDHNNTVGSGAAFHTAEGTDSLTPSSNTFTRCVCEQVGGPGFYIGLRTHSASFTDCRVLECAEEGIYLDGISHQVDWKGGQIEDCEAPGFRVQNASNVNIEGVYFEGNGYNSTGSQQCEIKVQNGAGSVYINNIWLNGAGSIARAIYHNASGDVEVNQVRYNDEYTNLLQVHDGTFTYHPQHLKADGTGSPTRILVEDDAERIYHGNKLVGAGVNEGGNDNEGGVDLSTVTGAYDGEVAMSDGTTATTGDNAYSIWHWDAGNSRWDDGNGNTI